MALCQYLLNVFTPFPLSSMPPTPHPPFKSGWHHSCSSFICHTSHDCWTTPTAQKPHIYSNSTYPRPLTRHICRKLETWTALNVAIILDIAAENNFAWPSFQCMWTLNTNGCEQVTETPSDAVNLHAAGWGMLALLLSSAPAWWWTKQLGNRSFGKCFSKMCLRTVVVRK